MVASGMRQSEGRGADVPFCGDLCSREILCACVLRLRRLFGLRVSFLKAVSYLTVCKPLPLGCFMEFSFRGEGPPAVCGAVTQSIARVTHSLRVSANSK